MEQTISQYVQDRLDKINWESLKDKYGISRDAIMKNPTIATQLANGQMTDLVQANTKEMSAMFSLRAFPNDQGEMTVKLCSMEKPKNASDTLYLYNVPITSEKVKEALLERTSWLDGEQRKHYGPANANGGRPISIELNGKKQDFLVSIHQPTNRVVGMPVDQVKSFLLDKDGHSRGHSMYGVKFTDEQASALAEGAAIAINGTRKDGQSFTCCVQFDAAQRSVVPCHPTWFKEAQKAGMNMGPKQEPQKEAKMEKPQEEAKKTASRAPRR